VTIWTATAGSMASEDERGTQAFSGSEGLLQVSALRAGMVPECGSSLRRIILSQQADFDYRSVSGLAAFLQCAKATIADRSDHGSCPRVALLLEGCGG
jgi:hypothetical protein